MTKRVIRLSETHMMAYVGDKINVDRVSNIAALCELLGEQFPHLIEIIPSYTSVMVAFSPLEVDGDVLEQHLHALLRQFESLQSSVEANLIELPAYYDVSVAPDLNFVAERNQLSVEQVIDIHSQNHYTVCAIGFAPGFAFLGSVDARIATPRHSEPRLKVAKGSVGIADQQTAVYPAQSPGGWQIIANCPVSLFDPDQTPMTPFQVGDKVRFKPIDRQTFIELGGVL
ncbi:sensor histidine kinase inhibitor, KipI family [Vibrio xiamenensis]|uniref:Sensor histidine kinase inhibitor, KipI family n=1 Tax=Vibrio xiamenensis TaxID=861298 RepID=A0A1G8FYK8_9VIBR|nr:5-oxoprolinase subunit PxpB [Vibrio xiamenensis]SDH87209.1 sensor histidine kinase inhibitor, KipI family [Vibrio xiamenensis]